MKNTTSPGFLASLDDVMLESQHAHSDNTAHGYHGNVDPEIHADKTKKTGVKGTDANALLYRKMHQTVRKLTGAAPKEAKHYLDSVHGRHLADLHNDNKRRGLADSNVHSYIKRDHAQFKKNYKADMFESDVTALKDTGENLVEWPTDGGANFKSGDKVIVKAGAHTNKRGTYGGMERGRHVVNHGDGSRSMHGDGALLKEDELAELSTDTLRNYAVNSTNDVAKHAGAMSKAVHSGEYDKADHHMRKQMKRRAGQIKAIFKMSAPRKAADDHQASRKAMGLKEDAVVNEDTKSADKKAIFVRGPNGKMLMKKITRTHDVIDAGGKKEDDES